MVRVALALLLMMVLPSAAFAQSRLALLIGNQSYTGKIQPLKNPHNDIQTVGKALEATGFKVTSLPDASRRQILSAVKNLAAELAKGGPTAVGFLYYSGHGVARPEDRSNYLIPVDLKDTSSTDFWFDAVKLDDLLGELERAAPFAAHFVVVDACREELKLPYKSAVKGFEPVAERSGMFIAFATALGAVALDEGKQGGASGPYSSALASELVKPGQDHLQLFQNVKEGVFASTGRQQVPWERNGLLRRVYFAGEKPAVATAPVPTPAQPAAPSRAEVAQFCQSVATNTSVAVVQSLLESYKGTPMAACAQARLDELKRAQVAVVVPPQQPAATPQAKPAVSESPRPPLASYSDGVIKIGVLNDQSSLYSDLSGQGSVWAARKAVEDFCKSTRCFDKIEVVSADHQNKPDIGTKVALQWYDIDKVDVIVDVPNSGVALAISNMTKEKNKVFLVSGAASAELTGKSCTPNNVHWTYDTWSLANGTGNATVKTGGDTWFFITADYAFGHALEGDTALVVERAGGRVLGKVRHPLLTQDFSSFLLQAQSSKAKIIGLANAGSDTINAIRQAAEFGIVQGGQNLAGLLVFISDVHALGLRTAQGLMLTEAWYWDANENNRAFARAFAPANKGNMPTMVQAGVYSALVHYLKAVHELKSDADGAAVVAKMKSMPTDDQLFGKGSIRADGRKIHDMYLFEVKKPEESRGSWDYYKLRATIPAATAFRPIRLGECALVK